MYDPTLPVADTLAPYRWVRTEDVLVTLVHLDEAAMTSTYLVQRTEPGSRTDADAFVVRFDECLILVNGNAVEFAGDWPEVLCTLADALLLAPSPYPGQSVTTRYEPA